MKRGKKTSSASLYRSRAERGGGNGRVHLITPQHRECPGTRPAIRRVRRRVGPFDPRTPRALLVCVCDDPAGPVFWPRLTRALGACSPRSHPSGHALFHPGERIVRHVRGARRPHGVGEPIHTVNNHRLMRPGNGHPRLLHHPVALTHGGGCEVVQHGGTRTHQRWTRLNRLGSGRPLRRGPYGGAA